jgi:uncharacterized membrane protein
MASAVRKWLPLLLIAAATAASVAVYDRLPPSVDLRLDGVLPFRVSDARDPMPREFGLFLVPVLTLLLWAAFRWAPTAAGQRVARRLFRNVPESVTAPGQFERFGKTYDTIVLGVVLLLTGFHAAILSALLQHPTIASRIISIALGGVFVMLGNVMPRLRPNWVAGLRIRRTLENPQLWSATHRVYGAAFVISGLLTIAVGLIAPEYGLVTGIIALLASCVVALVVSTRRPARVES